MSITPYQLPYSNPENIISAAPNTIFRRDGNRFSLKYKDKITELQVTKKSFANNYRDQVFIADLPEDSVTFQKPRENWIKTGTTTGKTGWVYLNDKNQQLQSSEQVVPLFFANSSNYTYKHGQSGSHVVSLIYTGSVYSGYGLIFYISSSNPNWYYSGSSMVTSGALLVTPAYGDTSENGAPWSISFTSAVPTSSLLILNAEFKYDGTASVSGPVTFHSEFYVDVGPGPFTLQNSHKFVITSGSA